MQYIFVPYVCSKNAILIQAMMNWMDAGIYGSHIEGYIQDARN